jgi:ATP-GRASP peptide maturase of grasp-with-spasm system
MEVTTSEVVAWIGHLGGTCVRLNGEDLLPGTSYALDLAGTRSTFVVDRGGTRQRLDDVRVVFYRGRATLTLPSLAGVDDARLARSLGQFMYGELREMRASAYGHFGDARWFPDPAAVGLNKIVALRAAQAVGLEIPATLLTTDTAAARRFLAEHGKVIIKSLSPLAIESEGDAYWAYTEVLTPEDLAAAGPSIFPCVLQAYAEKQYEIRVFYIGGRSHAMAIFSQLDDQTAVDFRRYNWSRRNRCVPVRLPTELREKIGAFMERVGLSTGSLDIIKRPDGAYVFLEVNPVGQFGFVSAACNYQLEREVARLLMAEDAAGAPS